MCNTDRDRNKGKEKVNEEPIVNSKTMEIQNNKNKRKAIVLVEPDVETKNSKTPNNGDAGDEESTHSSSKEMSPFLLFGFIIDPNKRIKHAYSCNFCSRKFITSQALGGHQNCHKWERKLRKRIENMNNGWINYANGNQGMVSQNTIIPYHGGYGYDNMIQGFVSQQTTMTKIDYGLFSNGNVEREDQKTEEEGKSKIDLTLKL